MNSSVYSIKVPVRVMLDDNIALGPGKVELLAAIASAGSISGAARQMGMSYRRAWMLVETMNDCFLRPLVVTATGGKAGGGAQLTPEGEQVLAAYRAMQKEVGQVAGSHLADLLARVPLRSVDGAEHSSE